MLMFMFPPGLHSYKRDINIYKHKHKHKKMETIPFSYAYTHVTPGLHSFCFNMLMSQCKPGYTNKFYDYATKQEYDRLKKEI